jgi:DNA processing protein
MTGESVAGEGHRSGDPQWRARVAWSRLAEPGDPVAAAFVERHGLVEALGRVRAGIAGTERYAARAADLDVDTDLMRAEWAAAAVVVPGDPRWPEGRDDLEVPPYCLWVRGSALSAGQRAVAVVGSRAATAYGVRVAEDLGTGLASRGFAVVSGAAYGIDGAAHRGALAAEGATIAVVAGGVDRVYPVGHARLLEEIVRTGAVVSEVPPGAAPTRTRFLARNRLIAAMTIGTVVVEAAARSGSLNTARWAATHHRPVAAVPGPVTSMMSTGCHQLVRDGVAVLVTDATEVVELVGRLGDDLAEPPRGPVNPEDLLAPGVRHVYAALPVRRAVPVESLAKVAGRSESDVLAALGRLNIEGLAERVDGGWRRLARAKVGGSGGDASR